MNILKKIFGVDLQPGEGGSALFHHAALPGGKAVVSSDQKALLEAHLSTASIVAVLLVVSGFLMVVLGQLLQNGWIVFIAPLLAGVLGFVHVRTVQRIVQANAGLPQAPVAAPSAAKVAQARKVFSGFALFCIVMAVVAGSTALISDRNYLVVVSTIGCGLFILLALVFCWVVLKTRPST